MQGPVFELFQETATHEPVTNVTAAPDGILAACDVTAIPTGKRGS